MAYLLGFDLSYWDGKMDFAKAKAAGISYSYTKATQGVTLVDSTFAANHAGAKAAGLLCGAYHFIEWIDGAKQAEYFWNHIKADPGTLRPVIDYEGRDSLGVPTPSDAITVLKAFVQRFEALSGIKPVIYTGLSFWMEHGSKDAFWKDYPLWFAHPDTTEPTAIPLPWATWDLWQWSWSGDGPTYGASSKSVDMDWTTPERLARLLINGGTIPPTGETMTNAIGLYTKTALWTNPAFNFIVGFGSDSWLDPNPNLKAIDEQAAKEGKPLFVLHDFCVDFYTEAQYMADDTHWPPEANDEPLQKFITVMQNRNISGVIIRVMNECNHAGLVQDPQYISYASRVFTGRVAKWLAAHKPTVKLIVESQWDWIIAHAPHVNDWIGAYNNCAEQKTVKPLVDSLPDPTDKPNYLDNRATCEFRRYWEITSTGQALYEYRVGGKDALYTWLGFGGTVTPPPPPPDLEARVNALEVETAALQQQITVLANELATQKHHTHATGEPMI